MDRCARCDEQVEPGWDTCWSCGSPLSQSSSRDVASDSDEAAEVGAESTQELYKHASLKRAADKVVLTTAPSLDGFRIIRTLEVISAECVFGMNVFRELFAKVTDNLGGRSVATERIFRDARRLCCSELRHEAATLGSNAVIAVRLDFRKMSGSGKSIPFLVATGTAVVVEPVTPVS